MTTLFSLSLALAFSLSFTFSCIVLAATVDARVAVETRVVFVAAPAGEVGVARRGPK